MGFLAVLVTVKMLRGQIEEPRGNGEGIDSQRATGKMRLF